MKIQDNAGDVLDIVQIVKVIFIVTHVLKGII
jgi:hypothetical protein